VQTLERLGCVLAGKIAVLQKDRRIWCVSLTHSGDTPYLALTRYTTSNNFNST
jgi:hypothetical protein